MTTNRFRADPSEADIAELLPPGFSAPGTVDACRSLTILMKGSSRTRRGRFPDVPFLDPVLRNTWHVADTPHGLDGRSAEMHRGAQAKVNSCTISAVCGGRSAGTSGPIPALGMVGGEVRRVSRGRSRPSPR